MSCCSPCIGGPGTTQAVLVLSACCPDGLLFRKCPSMCSGPCFCGRHEHVKVPMPSHQWLVRHSPCSHSYLTPCRYGCGKHHVIMAESYYEETTESGCDTCHKGDHPSVPSVTPPSKGTKGPKGTPALPSTAGTKAPRWTPAPATTQVWGTTAVPATTTEEPTTAAPATTQVWGTTAAPATTTEEPTTAAPATTAGSLHAESCQLCAENTLPHYDC